MRVPFLALAREFAEIGAAWQAKLEEIGARGVFLNGSETKSFEAAFAKKIGTSAAIAAANGTDALTLALHAAGIGEGDEVITSPYGFFATVEAILRRGARPVFADIVPEYFTLDPKDVARRITPKTRAIIPVHLFGCPVDMTSLGELAQAHKLAVIEDCAQSCGAAWQGTKTGARGDFGCFSFYPTKVLGCYGDGGMITTSNKDHEAHIRRLSNHGASAPFIHEESGYNNRLDEIQAALLNIKLARLDEAITKRQAIARHYETLLKDTPLTLPATPEGGKHVFNAYTIRAPKRGRLQAALREADIACAHYYPLPFHLQPACKSLGGKKGDCPHAEQACDEALSLPIFPEMREDEAEQVAATIRRLYN